jgi:hypothetical protein
MHHVVALGRPLDRRLGRPADHAPRAVLAWGRGLEGQLGVRSFEDSAAPLVMDALKGRHVMQVGGWVGGWAASSWLLQAGCSLAACAACCMPSRAW